MSFLFWKSFVLIDFFVCFICSKCNSKYCGINIELNMSNLTVLISRLVYQWKYLRNLFLFCFVFCVQAIPLLDRLTRALACPWPCPHLGISPSTTPIPPIPQPISPPSLPPIPSTTATRAWSIATRLSWPTLTRGRRALAACCRLKARRARMVSRNRYLSVCLSICLCVFRNCTPHYLGGLFENRLCSNDG